MVADARASQLQSEKHRDELAKERRLRRFNRSSDSSAKVSDMSGLLGHHNKANHSINASVGDSYKPNHVIEELVRGADKVGAELRNKRDVGFEQLNEMEDLDGYAEKDWPSGEAILGSCQDMCPESERLERERKGDLDKYERVDGDRNQTNKNLAVKKYTRTAEKEPFLIRPLPVLQTTMEHLLNLIDRGYDDELLAVHNFLWDRMRSIRMDLRMQHLFNHQAVAMHEQMIRFHILAMHELCEYAKGMGFSEGFDAHLNIEQMNKASVDLFHMYDDLRKQGHPAANEAEFRGYYALLKLDKHPGYVVEPAELSLNLAKMIPEIRASPEIQFAREVARSCRTGNFLAFFRLTREATYLQACLMHAHFSKLRTQALASLYSGLQKNQGIPVAQVEEWLAMEREDIEALVQYHGFSLKNYEELYMVKEGPFMNRNRDFQTRRAKLVEEKQSLKVVDDVVKARTGSVKLLASSFLERASSFRRQSDSYAAPISLPEEEMPDYEEDEQCPDDVRIVDWMMGGDEDLPSIKEEIRGSTALTVEFDNYHKPETVDVLGYDNLVDDETLWQAQQPRRKRMKGISLMEGDTGNEMQSDTQQTVCVHAAHHAEVAEERFDSGLLASTGPAEIYLSPEAAEQERRLAKQRAEASCGKLLRILRRWKLRAASKAEERCWQQKKAAAALNSLVLGPPVDTHRMVFSKEEENKLIHPTGISGAVKHVVMSKPDITTYFTAGETFHLRSSVSQAVNMRHRRLQQMQADMDISPLVGPILRLRNPASRLLCWKLILYSGVNDQYIDCGGKNPIQVHRAGEWLFSKLMGARHKQMRRGLNSLADTVVWQELAEMPEQANCMKVHFCFIAKDVRFCDNRVENVDACQGASGLLFLVLEGRALSEECCRLHSLVNTVSSGANLPLLILYTRIPGVSVNYNGSQSVETDLLAGYLHLESIDRSKVGSWLILSILENCDTRRLADKVENQYVKCRGHVPGGQNYTMVTDNQVSDFLSDGLLEEGLSWLAKKSPLQPNLRSLHVRDLVLEYLEPSLKKLSSLKPSEVTPQSCVAIFNEALQQTADEVLNAACSCSASWPPVEVSAQGQYLPSEHLHAFLPEPGWNKATSLNPVLDMVLLAQLPPFPAINFEKDFCNWSLRRQKVVLEQMLWQYVNVVCGIRQDDILTLQVVDSILQRGCMFPWIGSRHVLVPNWVYMFQKIYQMRLMLLNSEPPPYVFVSSKNTRDMDVKYERYSSLYQSALPYSENFHLAALTLDEMIEMESQGNTVVQNRTLSSLRDAPLKDACSMELKDSVQSMAVVGQAYSEEDFQVPEQLYYLNKKEMVSIPVMDKGRFPATQEEIELDTIVTEFCKKVDQTMNTAKSESDQSCSHSLLADAFNTDLKDTCPTPQVSNTSSETPQWASGDGMQSFRELLSKCERAQRWIDEKLVDYFRCK